MTDNNELIFKCLFAICTSSFVRRSIFFVVIFKLGCLCFYCWILRVPCLSWIQVLYQICYCKCFYPVHGLSFDSLKVSFEDQMFLFLISYLPLFSFMNCAFDVVCKHSSPNLTSPRFFSTFSSRSFIVLCFIFRFMIHFESVLWKV